MPPDPPAPSRRGGRVLFALLTAFLFAGCRVDATVETRVEGRSGEVRSRLALDREAADLLGGHIDAGAQVEDLRRAGWVITPARLSKSGGVVVEVSKRFHRPGELGRVMAELSGPGGPLQGFHLQRRRSLTRTRYRLTGLADLRGGGAAVGLGNVPDLASRLRGAGVDPQRVEELLTSRAVAGFRLRVVADLPGPERADAPARAGGHPAWDVAAGEPVEIDVSSTAPDRTRPVLLGLAALAALAAVVVLGAGRRR
jgi:hypothetical protein